MAHNFTEDYNSDEALNINLMIEFGNNDIIITYDDNGIGLQYNKIKEKAVQQSKYTLDELNSMSQTELAELIFNSGLSTSDETDIDSGRGMGMSIIKQKIEESGGKIEVDSQEADTATLK